jgi:rare lipoprotein A
VKAVAAPALALLLAACGGGNYRPVSDLPVRLGKPYQVRGVTYVPAADPTYDVLGYAGWYGSESGNRTALGERFRPKWPSAAHPTLPLPTYLEVTALDTGRTVLVRVNDRGPFARGRILDLSRGAADLLGMRGQGVAPVRVRRVEPPKSARARLRRGKPGVSGPRLSDTALANLRAQLAAGVGAGLVQPQ